MQPSESSQLTPEQRLRALAKLLATAVLRLHGRHMPPAENLDNSATNPLEVSADPRLSVHTG